MTQFAHGAATDVGQLRQVNQDSILEADGLFAVADGMGGHRGGEVASEVAIDALRDRFVERTTDALVGAVQEANEAVVTRADGDSELKGMGTTLCALARVQLDDGEECLAIVNVGDSRAYLLKAGETELVQISEDHSLVATLERGGQLTREEAAVHPQRNILTRALGIDQRVLVDSFQLLPVRGDRYLLCSDGLFNEVDEPTIGQILHGATDLTAAAQQLVDLANEGGGRDNISVVIVEVTDDAGHADLLAGRSDEHRVIEVVHGPERVGDPADELAVSAAAVSARVAPPAPPTPPSAANAPAPGGVTVSAPVAGAAGAPTFDGSGADPAPAVAVAAPRQRTRFTWRVAVFLVALIAVFGFAAYTVQWIADNTFYVAVDSGQVVIFQGRPGGLLWTQPKVAERTDIALAAVPVEFRSDIEKGKDQPSLEEARAYLQRITTEIDQTTTTTTTSTSRVTTTAPSSEVGGLVAPGGADDPTTTATSTP
jgi:serine/threonine protein phosphatase PrpC